MTVVTSGSTRETVPQSAGEPPSSAITAPSRLVTVRKLSKSYKRRVAVQGADLTVNTGEIYGLIGPDGAGKSSLMKAIAGVLTFDEGSLNVFGFPVASESSAERIKDRIGFMPQGLGLNLYPDLSVEENIDYFGRLRLVAEPVLANRKRRLLAMTRLDRFTGRPMRHLSGGMKQKLALVCTLIHEPELVILDEPTTGVDPVSRRDFWSILAELIGERGMTALVSTAYLDEASRFHHVSLMYGGRVVASGTPEEVQASVPGSLVVVNAADQPTALRILKSRFEQVEAVGDEIRVFIERSCAADAERSVRVALHDEVTSSIQPGEPDLEDAFVALLRREGVAASPVHAPLQHTASAGPTARTHIAIEADALTRDFGDFRATDSVSFRVGKGEVFGLLGANGAGKTTVIKMLTGILAPTSGHGHVAGKDMLRSGLDIKLRIGYVSQAFSLYQDLTAVENIKLYAGIYGLSLSETRERAAWVLQLAGLGGHESDLAGSLPMGVRQRLALGCALVHKPQVLFLDEPTSGVDPVGRRTFWDILFGLSREEGVTVLVTTHYMAEAEQCDHLALMHAGRIVADASPSEMKRQVESEAGALLEVHVDRPAEAMRLLDAAGYRHTSLFGQHVHLLSPDAAGDAERISTLLRRAGLCPEPVVRRPLSMEDVFVYRITMLEQEREGTGAAT